MLTDHIADHDLEAYSLRRLADPETVPVEEHLLVCDYCQDRLAEWDLYCRAMRAACRLVGSPDAARQPRTRSQSASSE
ncbi:MAG: hypothetical protein NTW28_01625 [Candidatus Solibacter sp.]|nr:hypothetical protein [Candidatus Solibacter sp.]